MSTLVLTVVTSDVKANSAVAAGAVGSGDPSGSFQKAVQAFVQEVDKTLGNTGSRSIVTGFTVT